MAASPPSVETNLLFRRGRAFHRSSLRRDHQKLKSDWRLELPTMVLFESLRTTAFPGHARGDRVYLGSSTVAETNLAQDPHPRPYPFRINRRRASGNYRAAGKSFETAMSSNSVSWDRTSLLSSKLSARSPRSCEPASAAPSLYGYPSVLEPEGNCDKVQSGFQPSRRR